MILKAHKDFDNWVSHEHPQYVKLAQPILLNSKSSARPHFQPVKLWPTREHSGFSIHVDLLQTDLHTQCLSFFYTKLPFIPMEIVPKYEFFIGKALALPLISGTNPYSSLSPIVNSWLKEVIKKCRLKKKTNKQTNHREIRRGLIALFTRHFFTFGRVRNRLPLCMHSKENMLLLKGTATLLPWVKPES